jgi:hypothetical protein
VTAETTPRTVWVAHAKAGEQRFICGVFATQALAVERCRNYWVRNPQYEVEYYSDGDAYLSFDGEQKFVIQRHVVEIPRQTELSVGQHPATHP